MKNILFTYIIFSFTVALNAQIGINTRNPQTLFHIDGAATTATTNPISGAVSATQAVDDVVITTSGNVGVGHLSPGSKLDIKSATIGKALRIEDGTQGNLRVLTSDTNGVGAWSKVAGVWNASMFDGPDLGYTGSHGYRQYKNFSDGFISSATFGAIDQIQGKITVPYDGLYRIIQSAYFSCSWGTLGTAFKGCISLFVNGSPVWEPSALGISQTNGLFPTFITIRNLKKNDVLTICTKESDTSYSNQSYNASLFVEYLPQ